MTRVQFLWYASQVLLIQINNNITIYQILIQRSEFYPPPSRIVPLGTGTKGGDLIRVLIRI